MKVKSIDLLLDSPQLAEEFLCNYLFFIREKDVLVNGNCRLRLLQRNGQKQTYRIPGTTYIGMEHIALEAADIETALDYCMSKNLVLDTDNGRAYYNPLVWGTGMYYFNILTDFGVKFEVAQRLDREATAVEPPIFGLEHFGVQVASMADSLKYYSELGFSIAYPTVEIHKDGVILNTMLNANDFVVELYEFVDITHCEPLVNEPLYSLTLENACAASPAPNGELFQR